MRTLLLFLLFVLLAATIAQAATMGIQEPAGYSARASMATSAGRKG